ncbi:MAG: cobalamin B12-binding domain-containing protein [Eggerthellaceae bacterium]|nr:cobalamin B12-binding domain-containing protein [Eggerthellaceae bacterium]
MAEYILGASIGNCVHVAGVMHFLALAESEGYRVNFLGPATSLDKLFDEILRVRPDRVAISYRLTPENARTLLEEVARRKTMLDYEPKWIFGGTKPVADIAAEWDYFDYISDGFDDVNDSIRYLRGLSLEDAPESFGRNLEERIDANYPYPLLRHHFGRPSISETEDGIKKIAEAKVLDVVSLGTDQNAQEFFFHPELMNDDFSGAGGVPVRTRGDFEVLKKASMRGNYPLVRCYSGTADVMEYGKLLKESIDNAWTAVPLFWYNELDGRGPRTLEESLVDALNLIKWNAENGYPVEINEPHHWGLRDAHDVIPVAMAYICAYVAKKQGVKDYIAQFMFNNPHGLTFSMDLAKILAMIEIIEPLESESFRIYRETRAGLALFHADEDVAKGQLAASTFMQMVVRPHIIHVVGYCEANHAATADEVIESCKIVKGVIRHALGDTFSIDKDPAIVRRKDQLLKEAAVLLDFIRDEYSSMDDPLANPAVLCDCVRKGYIDAVHIVKNEKYRGNLKTKIAEGCCVAIDPDDGRILLEEERLMALKRLNGAPAKGESMEELVLCGER